jgi:hypothetical protein
MPKTLSRNLPGVLALALFPLAGAPLLGQELPRQSKRISSYDMEVQLLPAEKKLVGRQTITWRNATKGLTQELRFHLYLNAFRAPTRGEDQVLGQSALMIEAGSQFRKRWSAAHGEFGSMTPLQIHLAAASGPIDLLPGAEYISPDDGNPDDRTVWRVPLPKPVGPGERIQLSIRFEARLPKAILRTGWTPGNTFFCMQWFPKLGVLEDTPAGSRWNCHQYHANTEFYADFSTYKVKIIVPQGFKVGATGGAPTVTTETGATVARTFYQADVHDFAFVASTRFRVHEQYFGPVKAADDPTGVAPAVAKRMGVDVDTFDLPRTRIILMLLPEHDTAVQVARHMKAVKTALAFFGLRYGPYPYKAITLVDPGHDLTGNLGGGMEYPTLITCGTSVFPHPRTMQPEGVTVHEFGHQYWYGLSANNEFEESWLDEGINSYSDGRAQTLEYVLAVMQRGESPPTQTTNFGLVPLGGVAAPIHPPKGIASHDRIPFYDDLLERLPDDVRITLKDKFHFEGRIMPKESPLLDLIRIQPFISLYREAAREDSWNDRRQLFAVDNPDAMVRHGWKYLSKNAYMANSYHRPATLLRTMERMLGRDRWWEFMRRFHAATRFGHATTWKFLAMLGEHCGDDARRFFLSALAAQARLDYGVDSVEPEDGKGDLKVVTIRRYGTLKANVRIRFRFAGRREPVWREMGANDVYPVRKFTFVEGTDAANSDSWGDLLEVWVDPPPTPNPFEDGRGPAGVYLLDKNLLNNGWRAQADHRPAAYRAIRQLLQIQSELSFAGLIG